LDATPTFLWKSLRVKDELSDRYEVPIFVYECRIPSQPLTTMLSPELCLNFFAVRKGHSGVVHLCLKARERERREVGTLRKTIMYGEEE
jgi:hypothetical protein